MTSRFRAMTACFILVAAQASLSPPVCAAIVFDSFTPPTTQYGFSSPDNGVAIQVSVTEDLSITGISVLTEMLEAGDLRFLLYSHPDHRLLLLTGLAPFAIDDPGHPTWKESGPIDFTLSAGSSYLVGYVRNVGVNEVGDSIAESRGGVTSDLIAHCIGGFDSPTYSHECIIGVDFGVRLHAIPEPGSQLLSILGLGAITAVATRRKRRRAVGCGASPKRPLGGPRTGWRTPPAPVPATVSGAARRAGR